MKIKVYCDRFEITGHHPGEEDLSAHIFDLELPDGLEEKELFETILRNMPKGSPLTQYTLDHYEILG